jgi:hypothetical protein
MRDGQIFEMHRANARRDALILGQFEFLQTEVEAMRRVLRVSKLRDRIKFIIWPELFYQVCDAVQADLLAQRKAAFEKAAEKPKIAVVPEHAAPKLVLPS